MKALIISLLGLSLFVSGCASNAMKQRKEQRDKVAQSSRIYCDFVNGEIYNDVEVALNLEVAKRCDPDKNLSITQYRTPSENQGVMYCCTMAAGRSVNPVGVIEKRTERKSSKPAADNKAAETKELEQ